MKRLLSIAFLAVAGASMAQTFGPGAGFAIPDNSAAGAGSNIVIGTAATVQSLNWVSISFQPGHTWAGDLIVKLTHVESGRDVHLFSRVGSTTALGAGDSSNLLGTYRFFNSGASFSAAAVAAATSADNIANGDYARSSHFLGAGAGNSTPGVPQFDADDFTVFNGGALNGTWRLSITDNAGADTGSVSEWSMNATAVPEPATMAALGLGAAALLRRRRKS